MLDKTDSYETNGKLAHSNNSADTSSDESTHSKDVDTCCLRRTSNNSRETEQSQGRPDDKPSFSSIVDRRDRKGFIPLFFERASGNLLNPCFDSETLETEFQRFSVNVDKSRFQLALIYIAFACVTLAIYFAVDRGGSSNLQLKLSIGSACAGVIALLLLFVTKFVKLYSRPIEARTLSIIVSVLYAAAEVASFYVIDDKDFSYGARFGLATCIIIVIYTMMPALPVYGSLILALLFSIAHEVSASIKATNRDEMDIIGIILLHVCIHALGISIVFMAQIRRRSTFWRVGQSVVAKQDLDIEQQVKNRMIKSVMPKKVADFLIRGNMPRDGSRQKSVAFRPFTIFKMPNVSILFADIVGFTKMSAKKEADHLVQLLNLLFGKFDELTEINKCEKISTLGDCYYCVAGCPEESEYHAISCVEMGLDITREIKNFCQETKEDVDMRVGIHTGNVLCGIVGDRRRRFDVWSNDVGLANKMESAGLPGRVHISEKTLAFLEDSYTIEDGKGIERAENDGGGILKTYFIVKRNNGLSHFKPWKKEGDSLKNSVTSLQEPSPKGRHGKNDKVVDHGNVRLEGINTQTDEDLEKAYLTNENSLSLYSNASPTKGNLQKHLAKTPLPFPRLSATFNFTYGITLNEAFMRDAMRACNDNQLVKLMQEKKIQKEYFFNPPLNIWDLNFKDPPPKEESNDLEMTSPSYQNSCNDKKENQQKVESKYRDEGFKGFKLNPKVITFASPKVHFMFDVIICAITLIITIIAGLMLFHPNLGELTGFIISIVVCLLAMIGLLCYQCIKFSPSRFPKRISRCAGPTEISETGSALGDYATVEFQDANHNRRTAPVDSKACDTFNKKLFSPWITAHLTGGIIMCLPVIAIYSLYQDCDLESDTSNWTQTKIESFTMLCMIALFHFCSFTQLSYLMKSVMASIWCIGFILLLVVPPSSCLINTEATFIRDLTMVVVLQIVLISGLNRIHEKGVRANFYGDKEAAEQKNNALEQKQVADWLIQDMFPRHVSTQLKYTKHCSKNYDMVGVLFASIVNFAEFYEENFEGGLECIRVLHELVGDFDKELMKYEDIEKIKTVYGTTFMAASGLSLNNSVKISQTPVKCHEFYHLKSLVDFALGLQKTLNEFNQNMLGFRFRLRCGLNAGPVTAGVIGTMKPQYDVWGDTVNVASRMDSTGLVDNIQVDEECMNKLTDFYNFKFRGTIFVKGKGDRKTYLLVSRKSNYGGVMDSVQE